MTRRIIVWSIAVAGLLLATENVNAQSRTVTSVNTDRRKVETPAARPDDRRDAPIKPDPRNADARPAPRAETAPAPVRRAPDAPARPEFRPKKEMRRLSADAIRAFERESFDADRTRQARLMLKADVRLTTDEIIRMALAFDFDSGRLEFLELAYENCLDRWNFYRAVETLTFSSSRTKLIDYALEAGLRGRDIYYDLTVTKEEMKEIVRILKKESFDSDRLRLAELIVAGNWLTARQIAQMANTFEFDSVRMKFLRFAYEFCYDLENYNVAIATLDYSSNRRQLTAELARIR